MSKRRLKEIKPGMAIHCKTEEEAKELLGYLDDSGYCWNEGYSCKKSTNWEVYKESTCYFIENRRNITYGNVDSCRNYLSDKYSFVEYTDLIPPGLTAVEALKIIGEICNACNICDKCPISDMLEDHGVDEYQECFMYLRDYLEEVVEICTQWKADHEKKAPELEWVDICQIIKKYPDGRKECVHEEDLTYEPGFQASVAQEVLGRYIAEHEGEYFAVMEAICRVKGERA